MILYILVILTILVIISWMLIKNRPTRIIAGTITTLLLLWAVILASLSLSEHYGMKKETTTSKASQIYTAGDTSSPVNMLIVKKVGNDSDNYVMIYRDKASDSKASAHFVPNQKNITNAVKKSATYKEDDSIDTSTSQTTTSRWVWKSDFYKKMFDLSKYDKKIKKDDNLISKKTTVTVASKDWVVLTADQAKKLKSSQAEVTPEQQAQQKEQMKTLIQAQTMEYMKKNPTASKEQINSFVSEQTKELTIKAVKDQINKIK